MSRRKRSSFTAPPPNPVVESVFVVEPSPDRPFPWTGVTYLRFGAYPREVAERLLAAA
jgi:hypothetical protein